MLINYFKTAFRHLLRNKIYAFINVAGLAFGITCTLLAVLYWKDERSFDKFHINNPHLYRIITNLKTGKDGSRETLGGTGQVQGPAFKAAVPEIKDYVRILGGDIYTNLTNNNKTLRLRPLFVDTSFFKVFTFTLIKGNISTALKEVNSVIITEATAKKFFNSIDVIGNMLSMEADPSYEKLKKPLIVSAVVKDPPGNSSLQFDVLFTFEFMRLSFWDDNWLNAYLGTYVVLFPQANINAVVQKFNNIYAVHAREQLKTSRNNYGYDPEIKYGLQPVTDIHFNSFLTTGSSNEGGVVNASDPIYSYAFMGIAMFILLMAAINFINISIAGSLKRSKEVCIRKISGGKGGQIILQFLTESAILCSVSFLISLILMYILLPQFNSVSGKQLHFFNIFDQELLVYFALVLLMVILLTGLYPSYILSRFNPTEVLYNRLMLGGRNFLGRGLVVFQFSLAVFLLVVSIIFYSQMNYIRTKDLGYNPYHIIRTEVYGDRDYKSVISYLKNELSKESSVKMVSFGNNGNVNDAEVNNRSFKVFNKGIDDKYLSLMEIPLIAGHNLSNSAADRMDGAIVNLAFVKAAGLQQPIGGTILINRHYDSTYKKIVGIVKDFHFSSLREPILPMIMYYSNEAESSSTIWVKFEKSNQKRAMAETERIYKSAMPQSLYQFNFIDELNAGEYLQEQRWHKILNFASVIAFALCILGLFGLAHLSMHQRIKEIGIRKILGATVSQIVSLITTDFLNLILISIVLGSPAAWMVTNRWLQDFAYHIGISWWMFVLAGFVTIIVGIATVSLLAIKAAVSNPVNSLRTD